MLELVSWSLTSLFSTNMAISETTNMLENIHEAKLLQLITAYVESRNILT